MDQSPDGLEVLRGSSTYVYDGNWKLQTENGADGYHVTAVHWNYAATTSRRKEGAAEIGVAFGFNAIAIVQCGAHTLGGWALGAERPFSEEARTNERYTVLEPSGSVVTHELHRAATSKEGAHRLNIQAGDLRQDRLEVVLRERQRQFADKLSAAGAQALAEAISRLLAGGIIPGHPSSATHATIGKRFANGKGWLPIGERSTEDGRRAKLARGCGVAGIGDDQRHTTLSAGLHHGHHHAGMHGAEARVGETVADAAYRLGINIPLDCRDGACGTCKCRVESGTYDGGSYIEDALTEEEAASGLALACQARPKTDLVVAIPAASTACKIRPQSFETVLRGVERLSETSFAFTLDQPDGLAFLPGQYVNLRVPGTEQRRSYSFSSAPGADALSFLVRDIPGGLMSGWAAS